MLYNNANYRLAKQSLLVQPCPCPASSQSFVTRRSPPLSLNKKNHAFKNGTRSLLHSESGQNKIPL